MATMMVKPPGMSANPDRAAVYPSMVCMNRGNKSVLPSRAKPSMNIRKFDVAKDRLRNKC